MKPEFPIRILFDDGECIELDSPDDLLERVDTLGSFDSNDPRVWVRDALDRDVRLVVRYGRVEVLEV